MGLPACRVDEMLERVSLTADRGRRRVRNYSLGMRQRLGIATALIGEPEVLILDEPANGLDPAGIRWMRDLLRDYADKGGTVLLSSHLLHEIEVIADDIVVIGNGRIVAQGSKAELLQRPAPSSGHPVAELLRALTASGLETTPSATTASAPTPTPSGSARSPSPPASPSSSWDGRRRRTRGDVPRAHRGHAARRSSGMTAVDQPGPRDHAHRSHRRPIPLTRIVASSCARCSTPARASG